MPKKKVRKPYPQNVIKSLVALFQRLIERYGIEERVYVKSDKRGVILTMSDAILSDLTTVEPPPTGKPASTPPPKPKPKPERPLFEPGTADLKPEAKRILDEMINFLRSEGVIELTRDPDYPIRVEVHTDNTPISNPRYPSNRELSSARAESVVRYFLKPEMEEIEGLDVKRLSSSGFGEFRPIAANDTPENRAKNRRIEIIIVNVQEEIVVRKMESWTEVNPGQWMLTFGDMTNLMLTFFIFLFAVSSTSKDKLQETLKQFKQIPQEKKERMLEVKRIREKERGFSPEEVKRILETKGIQDKVLVKSDKRGLILTVSDAILFDSGAAEIKPEAEQVLNGVVEIFTDTDYLIRIEGHTDNVPIVSARYPTNWELSNGRAAVVARYFIERHQLAPQRFSVAGYGEFRPVETNDDLQLRAKNRRVEIVILNKGEVKKFSGRANPVPAALPPPPTETKPETIPPSSPAEIAPESPKTS